MTNDTENVKENLGEVQAKPKKKKPIMIFRPQNSKTGMVKAGQRPGAPKKAPAAPGARPARPADGAKKPAQRPADGTVRRPVRPAGTVQGQGAVSPRPKTDQPVTEETVKIPAASPVMETAEKKPAVPEVKQPAAATVSPAPVTEQVKKPAVEAAAKEPAPVQEKAPAAAAPEAAAKPAGAAPAPVVSESAAAPAQASAAKTVKEAVKEPVGETPKEAAVKPAPRTENARPAGRTEEPSQPRRDSAGGIQRTGASSTRPGQSRPASRSGSERTGERSQDRPRQDRTGASRDGSRDFGRTSGSGRREQGAPYRGTGAPSGTGTRPGSRDARSGQGRPDARSGRPFGQPGAAGKPGAPRAAADAKPFEKESRTRNDRGGKNSRNQKNAERQDKFDRMERGQKPQGKNAGKTKTAGKFIKPVKAPVQEEKIKSIILPETLTIKELADKMKIQAAAIVKKLFLQGKMVTINEEIDFETAEEIAIEYDVICEKEEKVDVIEELLHEDEDPEETLVTRPPVVCVMGHVDHGKTSLLDAIRNTHVIDREAGGITQHIGASVVTCNGQKITFLDTPGHEAFTAMRMRGANSTDIAILVVAADDGVMPQTVEAINHAKAAGIEIIVAINKIDKPGANVEKVKQELTEHELVAEDWGGSTVFVPVSAKTHEGIDTLLEMILLTAEVLELKANPNRRARGLVIEAQLDKGRGPVATVLVQKGTLHVGDPVCAGSCHGRVRAMLDDKGRQVKEAGPSTPVEILGFSDVPGAGEIMISPETEKEARSFAETFISESREKLLEETKQKMSLDDLFSQIQAGNLKELNLIVKADVQGSVEAVKQSLLKLSNDEVVVKIIHSAVGAVNESDVILASASNAIIIGFNIRPDAQAKSTAEQEGVDIRLYRVIYDAIADVEAAMKGLLDPVFEEKIMGHAQVRQTFRASGVGTIAGSYVLDGVFQRGNSARITREGTVIFDGAIASLKRFKDDVKEVKAGYECGIVFDKFNDLKEDDLIEAYTMVEVPR